jgi:hypothetical protein
MIFISLARASASFSISYALVSTSFLSKNGFEILPTEFETISISLSIGNTFPSPKMSFILKDLSSAYVVYSLYCILVFELFFFCFASISFCSAAYFLANRLNAALSFIK